MNNVVLNFIFAIITWILLINLLVFLVLSLINFIKIFKYKNDLKKRANILNNFKKYVLILIVTVIFLLISNQLQFAIGLVTRPSPGVYPVTN